MCFPISRPLILQVNNVKVDFEHDDNHKKYTVEAKAGDFIIGEVGRINISNGQTQEVGEPPQYSPDSPPPGSEVHGPGRPGVTEENSSGGKTISSLPLFLCIYRSWRGSLVVGQPAEEGYLGVLEQYKSAAMVSVSSTRSH